MEAAEADPEWRDYATISLLAQTRSKKRLEQALDAK
jgi:hypothetical protein